MSREGFSFPHLVNLSLWFEIHQMQSLKCSCIQRRLKPGVERFPGKQTLEPFWPKFLFVTVRQSVVRPIVPTEAPTVWLKFFLGNWNWGIWRLTSKKFNCKKVFIRNDNWDSRFLCSWLEFEICLWRIKSGLQLFVKLVALLRLTLRIKFAVKLNPTLRLVYIVSFITVVKVRKLFSNQWFRQSCRWLRTSIDWGKRFTELLSADRIA